MSSFEFFYENPKTIHRASFARFEDAGAYEFKDSKLYAALKQTEFKQVDLVSGEILAKSHCDVGNHKGLHYINLKGDYDYLWRWYHNEHRKGITRHGNYIMLYWIDDAYYWKLSESFIMKILTIPDSISDLFDFG